MRRISKSHPPNFGSASIRIKFLPPLDHADCLTTKGAKDAKEMLFLTDDTDPDLKESRD